MNAVRLITALFIIGTQRSEGVLRMSLEEILKIGDYDGALRPNLRGGATRVNVSLNIHSINLNQVQQVVELSGELVQEWSEPNLELKASSSGILDTIGLPGTSGGSVQERVWRPDLTSSNDLNPTPPSPQHYFLRISRSGRIQWTQRVRYNFPCRLDLTSYPLGSHTCTLNLHSLGYDVTELMPEWRGDAGVEWEGAVVVHGYSLANVKTSAKNVVLVQRALRVLRVDLELECESGWTVKHTIIPMIACVTCAYLVFWMNCSAISARMVTSMLSLVTAAIFHESTYRQVPHTPHTMAIEVFTGTCLTFIFVACVETVAVHAVSPRNAKNSASFAMDVSANGPDLTEERGSTQGIASLWLDRCFRVLYPAAFLAFNAVYWVLYN